MDMEPGIINVKQEVPGVGTMNQKVGFVSMLLSATGMGLVGTFGRLSTCLLYTSPSPRDVEESRMPSSA